MSQTLLGGFGTKTEAGTHFRRPEWELAGWAWHLILSELSRCVIRIWGERPLPGIVASRVAGATPMALHFKVCRSVNYIQDRQESPDSLSVCVDREKVERCPGG